MLKYIASVPIVLSVIAGAYGGLNYVNKLTTQIDDSSKEIMMLQKDIENIHQIYNDKTNRNSKNYTMAREELVKELIKALPNLINTEDSFVELVNKVKSPKGTTEAGLDSLNDASFDTIIFNAIQQATNRSIEISAELKNE